MVSHELIQQLPIDGDVFEYDRGSPALHNLLFWAAIIISCLPLLALAIGPLQPNQRLPAFALGVTFAACAWVMHWAHTELGAQVIVTPFGIVERTPSGKRVGILWSELASIRHRRWLMALEIDAGDGHRRIRVSYALKRFPQFMELLVSALKMLEKRAA